MLGFLNKRRSALRLLAFALGAATGQYAGAEEGHSIALGGELRERVDVFDAPRFGLGGAADTYTLQRLLAHIDARFGERARVFLELGHHDAFGKNRPLNPVDADRTDVQVAFLDVTTASDANLTLRAGRQELLLNATQRFIAVREGPNVRQSYDGLRVTWHHGKAKVDLLALRPVQLGPGSFDDRSGRRQNLWGLYAVFPTLRLGGTIDVFFLGFDRADATWGDVHGNEQRRSVGSHFAFRRQGWDFDGDGVVQFGAFSGRSIRASALGVEAGYTFAANWRPRVSMRFDTGTGGAFATSGRLTAFNPMFPKGAYFDESANGSWVNLLAFRPAITLSPVAGLTLQGSIICRWRRVPTDPVYVHPTTPLLPTLGNRDRYVGDSYVLDATFQLSPKLKLGAELVRQRVGPALRFAGARATTFAMVTTQFRF